MYENGVNSEDTVNYNLLYCHACLSSNRTLTPVGDFIDIYLKVCDNSLMNRSSQINVCWECLALLKKVQAFRRKAENSQKILDDYISKQIPLEGSLSNLTLSSIEKTTFDFPASEKHGYYLDKTKTVEPYSELDKDGKIIEEPYSVSDKDVRLTEEPYTELEKDARIDDDLMFKIEDVRGRCDIDILDARPVLYLTTSPSDVTVKVEHLESPEGEEEQRHRRWKRSAMLVYKRICNHRYAHHFMRPVSDELAPLYSRIVRRPTDLTTIRGRIKDGVIRTTAELTRDVQLMFANALMYNSSHHFIYQMTLELREEALRGLGLLAEAEASAECPLARLLRRHACARPAPPPAPVAPPPAPVAPPPAPRAPPSRRKSTVLDRPQHEPPKPAALRRRRATVLVAAEPPRPAEPRKKAKWDWPCIEDEYLIAKKFKNSVAVLL